MYQRIQGENWRYIWLVGDLHGCFTQLIHELKRIKFNPYYDLLVSVGDLIDRGPDSIKCLKLLEKKWFVSIRGNHEQMAMDAIDNQQTGLWALNGGNWYEQASAAQQSQILALLQQCHTLPLIIELNTTAGKHVIAHADYPADVYAWEQEVDWHRVLWDRQRISEHLSGHHSTISGADHFWFGHTPLKERYDKDNQHYIDTGAVFGGSLTLVRLQ